MFKLGCAIDLEHIVNVEDTIVKWEKGQNECHFVHSVVCKGCIRLHWGSKALAAPHQGLFVWLPIRVRGWSGEQQQYSMQWLWHWQGPVKSRSIINGFFEPSRKRKIEEILDPKFIHFDFVWRCMSCCLLYDFSRFAVRKGTKKHLHCSERPENKFRSYWVPHSLLIMFGKPATSPHPI